MNDTSSLPADGHFTAACKFQGTAKTFLLKVTPLTTIDFVTCLCSRLGLRQVKILSN